MEDRPSSAPPASTHGFDFGKLAEQMILAVVFAALGILLGGAPWLLPHWPLALLGFVCCGPMALVFMLSGLLFFLRPLTHIGVRVSVSPEGLTWKRFGRVVAFPWKEVQTVCSNHPSGLSVDTTGRGILVYLLARFFLFVEYGIHLRDGRRLRLGCLRGLNRLGQAMERESCRCLLPEAVQRYEAGEAVDFGVLRVSRAGINKGTYTQPWSDVTSIAFDRDGWLTIGSKEQPWPMWIVVSPAKVVNMAVLLALLAEIKNRLGGTWEGNPGSPG